MKSLLRVFGIYAAFLLQSLIFENINILSSTPDIVVTAVIFTAVLCTPPEATALGAFAGVLTDAVCGRFFGLYTLLYMYLAAFISHAVSKNTGNSPVICAWAVFVCSTVYEILCYMGQILFTGYKSVSELGADIFVKGLFSAIFAFLAVLIINGIEKKKKNKTMPKEVIS